MSHVQLQQAFSRLRVFDCMFSQFYPCNQIKILEQKLTGLLSQNKCKGVVHLYSLTQGITPPFHCPCHYFNFQRTTTIEIPAFFIIILLIHCPFFFSRSIKYKMKPKTQKEKERFKFRSPFIHPSTIKK